MMSDKILEKWPPSLQKSALLASARMVLTGSDYVCQWGQRYPDSADRLIQSGAIFKRYHDNEYRHYLATMLIDISNEDSLKAAATLFSSSGNGAHYLA